MMGSGAVKNKRVYSSPLLPPQISLKDSWMKELGSEVAGGGKDSQQTQPKTKNPFVRTGRPVLSEQQSGSSVQEIENVSNLTAKAPMKEQGDLFSSCVPVSVTRLDRDKDEDENVDADPVRTGRLVHEQPPDLFTQCEDIDIDFRVSGLPHAVVKQAEKFPCPHRRALQADLQQNNAYNPFSATTKQMIQDVGNVEMFELFETDPKTQCKACLSCWSGGIVYCTCGHLLRETVANRGIIKHTLDLLSFPTTHSVKNQKSCSSYAKQFQKCSAQNAFFFGIKELSIALVDIS